MRTHKDYIRELIINSTTDEALKAFLAGVEASKQADLYNNIILLMARNAGNERNRISGALDMDSYTRANTNINHSILSLLEHYTAVLQYPNADDSADRNQNPHQENPRNVNKNSISGNSNIVIDGVSGTTIVINGSGGTVPPQNQEVNKVDDANKKAAVKHIENGEFVEAFEVLDSIEVGTKLMQYNRFKDEYMAGLNGMAIIDFSKRLKFFVNQLK
jgi:hypothetical protein